MEDQSRTKPRLSGILVLFLLFGAILVLGDLTRRMGEARRSEQDLVSLQTEVAELEEENTILATQVVEATSEASIRAWAHGDAHMVQPGERLVVPVVPDGEEFQPTPTPAAGDSRPSNLDVWLALLFGG